MSLEDRQADACGMIEDVICIVNKHGNPTVGRIIQERFTQLNEAFSVAYQADDEDDGDRAYDTVEALEKYAEDLYEEWFELLEEHG